MAILRASHLAKSYKKRKVIKDVSLEVRSSQVVGLLGPNGAGKTTCFYMIVGIVPQDAGSVQIDNHDISKLPMHGRAQAGIGYLPQEPSVFRKLSVKNNILAILETRADLDKPAQLHQMESLLDDFNIQHIRESLGMSYQVVKGGGLKLLELWPAILNSSC